jgi:predicted nucleic acid-binding protein
MSELVFLLDTSAILTLIEDETGAERVEDVLRTTSAYMTWMSLVEVTYISQQERGAAEAERRYALMKALPLTLVWQVDEATVLAAARLKAQHKLSLADTIIASYALQLKATVLHKDPEFEALHGLVALEALPYKRR